MFTLGASPYPPKQLSVTSHAFLGKGQVIRAHQRGWMVSPKLSLPHVPHMHEQRCFASSHRPWSLDVDDGVAMLAGVRG